MAKKYQSVRETIVTMSGSQFEGSVEAQIKVLQAVIDKHPNHTDLYIDYDYDYNEYNGGHYKILGTRKETDKERNKRLAKARKAREQKAEDKAAKETTEKAELKRLLNKYGEELISE